MGWSTVGERCMKVVSIMYKIRIGKMDENRWVRKVCEEVGQKSKWLGMCKRVVKKCGLKVNVVNRRQNTWQVETMESEGVAWDIRVWKKVVNERVEEYGLRKWKQGISGKSTLKWYESKLKPMAESVYNGNYNSELLFHSRSQSLEVNARTYRWNVDGIRECQVCESGELESVYHVFIECAGYARERAEFLLSINELLAEEFIREWNENGMCKLLGLDGDPKMDMCTVKKYLKCMWQTRSRLLRNRRNDMCVVHNDHSYARV